MKDDVVVNPGDEIIFATGERFEGTKERVYMTYEAVSFRHQTGRTYFIG